MRPLAITAWTATSAIGHGRAAMLAALRERSGGLTGNRFADVALTCHTGQVAGLEAYRLPADLAAFDCRNNRLGHLALQADGFTEAVAAAASRFRPERVAVVLGTSTSGVLASEEAYRARDAVTGALPATYDFDHTHDYYSLARCVRASLGLRGPAMVVSAACASSARCFIDAERLIRAGVCDAAVVGGADTLCRMTLYGFAALELLSSGACRPCDAARDGLSIGEAAGFALLERDADAELALLGHGAASDGHHMSAPHPAAVGATAAMIQALDRAGLAPAEIDYINLHGTGTRANDAAEDRAVAAVFGPDVPCSSTKGWTGHTLGAAGILEAVIAMLCATEGFVPGCLNVTTLDPAFRARIAVANEARPVRAVLSNSFGFGGINCSLVIGRR